MAQEELTAETAVGEPGAAMSDGAVCVGFALALLERAVVGTDSDVAAADADVDRSTTALGRASSGDGALGTIVTMAELSWAETVVLALCAGIDLDRRAQRLVAVLTGTTRVAGPDLHLVGELLGEASVGSLADDARLRSAGLLELDEGLSSAVTQVVVPRRVAWALRDDLSLDPELPDGTEVAMSSPAHPGRHDLVLVHGADEVRRREAAITETAGLAFLVTTRPTDDRGWRVLVRMATVGGLGVVIDLPDGRIGSLMRAWLGRADHLAFALCTVRPLDLGQLPRRDYIEVAADAADVSDAEWSAAFPAADPPARRPTAHQLSLARRAPQNLGTAMEVVRRVTTGSLLKHATRIVPRVGWDDLVLPPSQERHLRALVDRYHQRRRVHDDWGLSLYPSPGVVALFSGPSGTGKTTSAEAIAHELGMDMFRVDLSALVSKYIGETEKNLEEIFSAANTGNYVLLFDEADSLFGSRSKVEDAKDRYANMEVSYLLQRLETYDGVVVLTSNFQGNIDQAFLRRIHVTVHFTVPSAEERERIWERALGKAPRVDLDLAFVADRFDITGGSIRNAALTAAFSAASRTSGADGIDMVDVLRAITTELTKLGRRPQDAWFGPWLDAVNDPTTRP